MNLKLKDLSGRGAVDVARQYNHVDTAELLENAKIALEYPDGGYTASDLTQLLAEEIVARKKADDEHQSEMIDMKNELVAMREAIFSLTKRVDELESELKK